MTSSLQGRIATTEMRVTANERSGPAGDVPAGPLVSNNVPDRLLPTGYRSWPPGGSLLGQLRDPGRRPLGLRLSLGLDLRLELDLDLDRCGHGDRHRHRDGDREVGDRV